jgi:hypothetical protein
VDKAIVSCSPIVDGVRQPSRTFVYFDSEAVNPAPNNADMGVGDMGVPDTGMGVVAPDGSPDAPFTDYLSAVSAARAKNAPVIVIAGSGVINHLDDQGEPIPLYVYQGVSLLGGFDADFARDLSQRPRAIGALQNEPDQPSFVAAVCQNLLLPTAIEHIAIETADVPATAGSDPTYEPTLFANNYGIWLDRCSKLSLIDVSITVGSSSDGFSAAVYCVDSEPSVDDATYDSLSVPPLAGPPGAIAGKLVDCGGPIR